jgi:hypothetical protein
LSAKVHRLFSNGWAISAGSETFTVIGDAGDGGRSNFVVTSRMFYPQRATGAAFSAVGVSLGLGDGRYRPINDVRANRNSIGVFGAVSTRVTESLGAIADWNGQDLTLSASWVPLRCVPLTISPGITDVTGNAGSDPRFILGVGMGLRARDAKARFTECVK